MRSNSNEPLLVNVHSKKPPNGTTIPIARIVSVIVPTSASARSPAAAVPPHGVRRGHDADDPRLAGEDGEAEADAREHRHSARSRAARARSRRRPEASARCEKLRGLRIRGVERDRAGDQQPGRPPTARARRRAAAPPPEHERRRGHLQRREHVQRAQVAAARQPERRHVQEGREWRLAVGDVAVERPAARATTMPIVAMAASSGSNSWCTNPGNRETSAPSTTSPTGRPPRRAPSRAPTDLPAHRAARRGGRGWGGERARRLLESGGHPDIRASAR